MVRVPAAKLAEATLGSASSAASAAPDTPHDSPATTTVVSWSVESPAAAAR